MKYKVQDRGKTRRRWLWFGDEWDGGGWIKLCTWRAAYWGRLELSLGGEDRDVTLAIQVARFAWVLSVYLPWLARFLPDEDRGNGFALSVEDQRPAIGLPWADAMVSVWVWNDDMCWESDQLKAWPWQGYGWSFFYHPFRWVVGDTRHEELEGDVVNAGIAMPEGVYPATIQVNRSRWTRPRWFDGPWMWRARVKVPNGVPIPGKGENSWDCEDDAVFGSTLAVELERPSLQSVADQFAENITARRQRYASSRWVPSDGWPSHLIPNDRAEED